MTLGEGLVSHLVQSVVKTPCAGARGRRPRCFQSLQTSPLRFLASPTTKQFKFFSSAAIRPSGETTSAATRKRSFQAAYDRPLMVHRYPTAIKAFYMQPDPERPELAL